MTISSDRQTCTARRHGTAHAYNTGCRCPDARHDATRRRTRHALRALAGEPSRVDATGTRRRIRALIANGWPRRTLATELGITPSALDYYSQRTRVLARTATAVAELYDRLADHPGPSAAARAQARSRGWLPPIWWDEATIDDPTHTPPLHETTSKTDLDPVVVDRACDGQVVALTVAERIAAVTRLTARGHTDAEIATILHSTRDAICHVRKRHGIPAGTIEQGAA